MGARLPLPAPRRAAIYTRKSPSAGLSLEYTSLDAQHDACAAYVRAQGWALVPTEYRDAGVGGATLDRPALTRLLKDVEAGLLEVVVVHRVDRLSRSLLDFARLAERLAARRVELVCVTQQLDTTSPVGRLTLHVLLSFASFERELIGERTRAKIRAVRARGVWTGARPPYGYRVRAKRLVVDARGATHVRLLFALLVRQRDPARVARALTERGIPTPLRRTWTACAVRRMARCPIYGGLLRCGPELVAGRHAALVSRRTWDAAQRVLDAEAAARAERVWRGPVPA